MTLNHAEAALAYWDAGYSIIPILANGTKKPQLKWEQYQTERATRDQVKQWFTNSPTSGIGIICGAVSGNVEMLELEGRANDGETHTLILDAMREAGLGDFWSGLLESGYVASTPSGGLHLMYRISDHPVPGNTKIARRPANAEELAENPKDRVKVLSETRGEGGYFIAAPTGGAVHKSGESWSLLCGEPGGNIWELDWSTRCDIIDVLHATLDAMPAPAPAPERPVQPVERTGLAPGEDYNNRTSWRQLLESYGWTYDSMRGTEQLWVRPGKDRADGPSASLFYNGSDNLYVWSTSTELPTEEPISKFAFYAFMEHNGDFSAAASALSRAGFGEKKEPLDISDWFEEAGVGTVVGNTTPAVATPVEVKAKKIRIEQFSEKGIGRYAGELLRDKVRFVSQEKAWRVYGSGIWARDHEQRVPRMVGRVSDMVDLRVDEIYAKAKEAFDNGDADGKERFDEAKKLKTFAKGIATNRGLKAVAEIASSTEGVGVSAEVFDSNLNLIALNNGTFDLSSMTLRPHNPDDMLTKRIPVAYDPDAQASRWVQYLEEVIPDPEYREYLQRAVGMALLGDTSEAAFFVLWGETGCGKSQFIDVVTAVFGDYGVTAAASAFRESRSGDDSRKANSLHALKGARVVMTSETSKHSTLDGELVKRVTGGDSVKSHALYETEVEWKPVFTMFMATNFKPVLDAADGAIWRRVKPIEFPMSFFRDGRATENREKGLAQKIIATELPGVLNWVLEGVRAYRELGLKDPSSMNEALKSYREDSDPVISFLNEAVAEGLLIADKGASATMTELYRVFFEWSRQNGTQRPLGKSRFGQRLEDLGYKSSRGAGGVRYRKGLKLNPANWIGSAQGARY